MLERMTGGRYRSTPHRVRNTGGDGPAVVPVLLRPGVGRRGLPAPASPDPAPDEAGPSAGTAQRPTAWTGTYGDYLLGKVAKVFPDLFDDVVEGSLRP